LYERHEQVFYTAEEVKAFRTLGLGPGLKLLGFKKRKELRFEDNVKHSLFLFPNEAVCSMSVSS
jgi:ATP-dependent DNA helicase 2 subunit 1